VTTNARAGGWVAGAAGFPPDLSLYNRGVDLAPFIWNRRTCFVLRAPELCSADRSGCLSLCCYGGLFVRGVAPPPSVCASRTGNLMLWGNRRVDNMSRDHRYSLANNRKRCAALCSVCALRSFVLQNPERCPTLSIPPNLPVSLLLLILPIE